MREILVMTSAYACPPAHTDYRGGGGQPLGTGVFGQISLAGNRVAALHLATRVFPAENHIRELKDGAYYCYCAYVLRISRFSDFLSPMLTNTGIFLRGLKLSGESRS